MVRAAREYKAHCAVYPHLTHSAPRNNRARLERWSLGERHSTARRVRHIYVACPSHFCDATRRAYYVRRDACAWPLFSLRTIFDWTNAGAHQYVIAILVGFIKPSYWWVSYQCRSPIQNMILYPLLQTAPCTGKRQLYFSVCIRKAYRRRCSKFRASAVTAEQK